MGAAGDGGGRTGVGARLDHLAALDVASASDAVLADVLADWDRLASYVAAQQLTVVQELLRRGGGTAEHGERLASEIGCALAETRQVGVHLVHLATMTERAPEVHDALARGLLSTRKAKGLLDETAHLAPTEAEGVHRKVLGEADGLTAPQLRARVRREVLASDPKAAETRRARARAERGVWLTPAADAMAYLTALLPAEDAVTVLTTVDALAAAADADDDRGIDARRADALVDVMRGVLDRGTDLAGRALPERHGRRPHLQVTCTIDALVGLSDTPAELAGYGPVPAGVARRLAAVATWSVGVLDRTSGEVVRSTPRYRPSAALVRTVLDRDVTCTFPGCRVPAARADLDHLVPFDPARPAREQTRPDNLAALCRHHHRMKTHGGWRPHRDPLTGVTLWFGRNGLPYTRDPVAAPAEARWTRRTADPSHEESAKVLAAAHLLDPGSPDRRLVDRPDACEDPPTGEGRSARRDGDEVSGEPPPEDPPF